MSEVPEKPQCTPSTASPRRATKRLKRKMKPQIKSSKGVLYPVTPYQNSKTSESSSKERSNRRHEFIKAEELEMSADVPEFEEEEEEVEETVMSKKVCK